MKFKWYTDGVQDLKIQEGQKIPEGFKPGRRTAGRPAWNKGLTKKDNPNLGNRSSSFSKGHIPWNKGRTKLDTPSLQVVADKVSSKNKGKPAHNKGIPMKEESRRKLSQSRMGQQSWAKGLTKETDPRIKTISDKLLGHSVSQETIAKGWETKHRNGTCKSSKPEDKMYESLCLTYGNSNVLRNYQGDPRYPHPVDFYIVPEDLFIELNLFWMHNDHPFNPNSVEDMLTLQKWREKADSGCPQYQTAIRVWTQKDPLKLATARQNNLNFKFIYKNLTIVD